MAYDEELAARTRAVLGKQRGVTEKKMFGGLAFLVDGHMCCGIVGKELMVRVGRDAYEDALAEAHARPMDFTGKPLRGMIYVSVAGLRGDKGLSKWVERALRFAASLPPKSQSARRHPRK